MFILCKFYQIALYIIFIPQAISYMDFICMFPKKNDFSSQSCSSCLLLILFVCMILLPASSFGLEWGGYSGDKPDQVSWNISARAIEYDQEKQVYVATDDVVITGGATRLEAAYVEYSDLTKNALARGNVILISGQDVLSCDSMEINLATQQGVVENGSLFLEKNHLYVEAATLRKTGKFTYSAAKGSITSCKGKVPDWKITGKDIRVTIEGYGIVNHASFRIKNMPLLYTPFMIFPVQHRRQTGFLAPMISHSDRQGFSFDQPFFLVLSRNTDLTLSAHYMSDRGVAAGAGFRYVLDSVSRGSLFFDFLKDSKVEDGSGWAQKHGFSETPQRFNDDRYWFRMKADQALPLGIKALVDLDIVSDADYLREFRKGHTGYDRGQAYFEDGFSRGVNGYSDTIRKNTLTLYRSLDQFSFSVQTVWYDDVIARRHGNKDTTLQTLPALGLDMVKMPLWGTGLYYSLDSEFRSFYRKDSTPGNIRGQRLDLFPKIYYPMRLNRIFFLEPFLGVRTTAWHAEDFLSPSGDREDVMTRVLPTAGAFLSTTMGRVFALDSQYAQKIRHEITPGIFYEYIPEKDQDDLPVFDALDRVEKKNAIGWSVTQTFTAKREIKGANTAPLYHELAWVKLSQNYAISGNGQSSDGKDRSWSDIFLEAEIYPSSFFSLDADLSLCPYTGDFRKINLGANVKNKRGDSLVSAYRYAKDDDASGILGTLKPIDNMETWYNEMHFKVNRNLELYGVFERDLYAGKTVEVKAGIFLERSCWSLDLAFSETIGDKRLGFLVNLSGLGQWGNP